MAYRGGDLDLRTPRTWSATAPETAPAMPVEQQPVASRNRGAYVPGPIWVDEVVLACVNHAYDVALAHRAGEVRLEHLLHALTRIDTAAEALEARGVRVAALRRESATVIASELPVGLTNGKAMPRHSEELEHVLRAASLIASRRNVPATVDDVLHLILDVEPDLPGLSLLSRVSPRPAPQSEPVFGRAAPQPEPRYGGAPGYYVEPPREVPAAQPAPAPSPALRAPRGDFGGTAVDNIQNSRLDALEQMVRALSADLGVERKAFGGMLQELQRDVSVRRDEASQLGGGIVDSLQGMLAARLNGLELAVAPVSDRVGEIERMVSAGLEQFALSLSTLENDLRRGPAGSVDLAPLTNRLDIIEEAVLSRDGERLAKDLAERLEKLEQAITVERTHAAEAGAALRGEIGVLAQSVERQRAEIADNVLTPLGERLAQVVSEIDSRQSEAVQGLGMLGQRLGQLEQLVGASAQKLLESEGTGREELSEIQDALVKLNANQHTLAGTIDQWRSEGRQAAGFLGSELRERLASLEVEAQRVSGLVDGLAGSVEKMHRVTVERYHRRHRFWYWLFGTDDWVAASWPSQTQRITEELRLVKAPPSRK